MGAGADTFDSMASIAPPVGRGWEYLTDPAGAGGYDWDDELDQVPELLAEKLKAPSIEAGRYDLVIHPSNLWLTIHESIGHATELDRALGYEANYAGTSFATYDKLNTLQYGSRVMNVTGDRTVEHGLATVGYDDEGVETQQWDIVKDGVLVGYQLDRPMGHMKPGAQRRPLQRLRVRRLLRPHPHPADGQRVAAGRSDDGPSRDELIGRVEHGLYVVGDKSWSIDMQRFNFQFTAQRFYRIENGELVGPGARRRLPGHHDRLLGSDGGGRRARHLGAARRLQLRQGPAGPGRRGQPRCAGLPVPRHPDPQHHRGGRPVSPPAHCSVTPQSLVEHALATSVADDTVVIVRDATSANLRWANNTLTTNGVMHGIQVTVIAFVHQAGGTLGRVGQRQREHPGPGHRAGRGGRRRSPGRRTRPRTPTSWSGTGASADWDVEPGQHRHHTSTTPSRPALGEAFGRASAEGRILYGFVNHEVTTTYLGSSTGLRLRHVQPTGHWACTGKPTDLSQSAWVGGATRDFADVDPLAFDATLAQRLGWGKHRHHLEAGRYDTILPPSAVADVMIDAYWYAGARVAWEGQSVYSRRPTGTRIGEDITRPEVTLYSDPAFPGLECAPFAMAASSSNESSVFDNGLGLERTDWIRDGELTSLLQTRHSAAMTSQPVTPAIDNLVLEIGGGTRLDRRPRGRDGRRAARHLLLVHPRGRPADAAADRPDPGRRLQGRARRDRRRGQQLPLEREPDRPAAPVHRRRPRRCRASAGSGATTTSRAPRPRRSGSPTSTCRASLRPSRRV